MRKIFTFLVLLCCATTLAFSAPVGRQQARQAALAFIKSHISTNSQVATRASQATPSLNEVASTNAYYIFNVGKGQGFVIASADDRTADVLGYAEEGTYDEQQCPASLKMLLAQYRQEVSMLNNMPATTKPATTRAGRKLQPIEPLLKPHGVSTVPTTNKRLCTTTNTVLRDVSPRQQPKLWTTTSIQRRLPPCLPTRLHRLIYKYPSL